jgi:transposase
MQQLQQQQQEQQLQQHLQQQQQQQQQHQQILQNIKEEQIDIKPTIIHRPHQDLISGNGNNGSMEQHHDGSMHAMVVTPEIVSMMTPVPMDQLYQSDASNDSKMVESMDHVDVGNDANGGGGPNGGPKTWTQDDMDAALNALKTHNMSLTKASATYGIPSTTLWQRAHRMGIDTPKKEGPSKTWNEDTLNHALEALRTGTISANKASKAFGIPSSTLYKIARREGIRLAAPFNAAPTTWTAEDLERALEAIRAGQASVQKASTEFGIPTGTLYGRCKREGIELSRSNPTPWSEDAMMEALESVRWVLDCCQAGRNCH